MFNSQLNERLAYKSNETWRRAERNDKAIVEITKVEPII